MRICGGGDPNFPLNVTFIHTYIVRTVSPLSRLDPQLPMTDVASKLTTRLSKVANSDRCRDIAQQPCKRQKTSI